MATRDLEYKISAKDRTKRAFRGVAKGLNSMRKSLFNFKTAMVAVAGVAGFALMIKATLKSADANKKLADRLGLTTQQLAGYEYASVLAGESVETVQNAFQKEYLFCCCLLNVQKILLIYYKDFHHHILIMPKRQALMN